MRAARAPAPSSEAGPALAEVEILQLGERGCFVREGFLGAPAARAVAGEARRLAGEGAYSAAGVSRGSRRLVDRSIRDDRTLWVFPEHLPALHGAFERLRQELNAGAYLGLDRFDVQLAWYAAGSSGYQRHRDAFERGPRSRRLTAICYLNPHWRRGAGGELRLHLEAGAVDVEPVLDRLVVFLSEQVEHQVLPTQAERFAATAWYYGPS